MYIYHLCMFVIALSTLCCMKAWPQDALEMVANKFLEDVELEGEAHKQCVTMCQYFHQSVRTISEKYAIICTIFSISVIFLIKVLCYSTSPQLCDPYVLSGTYSNI